MTDVLSSFTFDGLVYEALANDRKQEIPLVPPAVTYGVVEEWHRDVHTGAFPHCDQQPCHAIHLRVATEQVHKAMNGARR